MSNHKKSVSRRRSRSLVGFVSRDLCQTIPKALSPSDRLMMLLEQSFQYALSEVQKDVMFKKDFDISDFRQSGTKCWEEIKIVIEKNDLHKSAVGVNGTCDSFVEANSEECNKTIALVEAESEKWSNKISYYRESLMNEINSSYSVTPSDLEMKNHLCDCSDVISETVAIERKVSQQIKALQSTRDKIEECLNAHKICHTELQNKCAKYFYKDIPRTPRTIIREFTSLRRNIKSCDINE